MLGGLLTNEHFEAWECLARIVEFWYCQGRNGWTVDSAAVFQQIVLRYNILLEESQGLRACHVVNHNLTHIHEDVLNFGAPDNYWCYTFERAVQRYVTISNNHKNIEVTFESAFFLENPRKVTLRQAFAIQKGHIIHQSMHWKVIYSVSHPRVNTYPRGMVFWLENLFLA